MYLIRRIKLCLEQHGSLSSVISVKVLVNVLKIVEEKVRYFNILLSAKTQKGINIPPEAL